MSYIRKEKNKNIVDELLTYIDNESNFGLSSRYLDKKIVSVFRDEELIGTAEAFFKSNLNVSETSKNTFMHRNTLIYRIDKIYKITGLNIRKLDDAVTFISLKAIYDKINKAK